MIRFACPGCRATYSVSDEQAGQTGTCTDCDAKFLIPSAAAPPAAPQVEAPPPPLASVRSTVLRCPTCEAKVRVDVGDIGHTVECPDCRATFVAEDTRDTPDNDDDDPDRRYRRKRSNRRRGEEDNTDEEDYDPRRRSSRRRANSRDDRTEDDDGDDRSRNKPSEVQTMGVLLMVGGILACIYGAAGALFSGGFCCFWPGMYYELVYGIMAIVKASNLLGSDARNHRPNTIFVMGIITIINADVLNLVFGIIGLSLAGNPNLRRYFHLN